jgi:phosphate-selective porin OprO and OprP
LRKPALHTVVVCVLFAAVFPPFLDGCFSATPETTLGYRDEVPPIDQREIDALRKRIEEVQKRLHKGGESQDAVPTPDRRVERPGMDYQDDVAPLDPDELEGLQRSVEELQQRLTVFEQKRKALGEHAAPAPPAAAPSPGTEQHITALEQRITELERILVGKKDEPGLADLIGGWTKRNGFFLQSAAGDFFLRFTGILQADFRSFPGGQDGNNPSVQPSTFLLQRARFSVHGRLYRYFRFLITPDLGNGFTNSPLINGRPQLFDGFVEWDRVSEAHLRVGKFKNPIGLEMLQGIQNLSFMERSLVRNLIPNRDLGAMLSGQVLRGRLEYQLGVFNGAPSANFAEEGKAFSTGKSLTFRWFSQPFLYQGPGWLQGFGVGFGMSYGSIRNFTGQDPMQTESFSYTFFQYTNNVTGNGDQLRFLPQMYWYWKRAGLMGQYVRTTQDERIINGAAARLTHDAWSAQASFFLTDDTATYGRVDPRRPFAFSKPGHWGAWELAVRYAQITLDPETFSLGMSDAGVFAQRAESTTVGLNWYLNYKVKIVGNFVHTDFTGATSAYHAASKEDALMFRVQLVY